MNLIYQGDVSITFNHKTVKYKNKGTFHLFRLFSYMLYNGQTDVGSLPAGIMIYEADSEEILNTPYCINHKSKELLTTYVLTHKYTTESTENNERRFHTVFDATVAPEYLIKKPQTQKLTLALISADEEDILAAIPFNLEYINYLIQGSSAIINWTLTLKNSNESTE